MAVRLLTCGALAAACLAQPAYGQQVTVQQPAFRVFSVNTTVSVPDRGAAYLGGVSRAADSRSRFGPLRSGTGIGTAREHAGMNVGVWIHDFDEMDRALPGRAAATRQRQTGPELTGYAAHSYRSLLSRRTPGVQSSTATYAPPVSEAPSKAERYYRLGLAAEGRGSSSVARLHFRTAARYGSALARERLERLDAATVVER